jgi:hypothetical protein
VGTVVVDPTFEKHRPELRTRGRDQRPLALAAFSAARADRRSPVTAERVAHSGTPGSPRGARRAPSLRARSSSPRAIARDVWLGRDGNRPARDGRPPRPSRPGSAAATTLRRAAAGTEAVHVGCLWCH